MEECITVSGNFLHPCEISGSHGSKYEDETAFWDIVLYTVLAVDQYLRGAYCLQLQGAPEGCNLNASLFDKMACTLEQHVFIVRTSTILKYEPQKIPQH
jgi:hypothetical protein